MAWVWVWVLIVFGDRPSSAAISRRESDPAQQLEYCQLVLGERVRQRCVAARPGPRRAVPAIHGCLRSHADRMHRAGWVLTERRSAAGRLAARHKVRIVTAHGPPASATIAARVQGNADAHSLPGVL